MSSELKLIKIHKRNLEILAQQKARLGEYLPVHVQNQIDSEQTSIAELEAILQRRLHGLLEKLALYGLSADPSISIEVEDIQAYFKEQETINEQKKSIG
jgi:hypothetical protein